MERKEKERQKIEQERRKEREEEDALEQVPLTNSCSMSILYALISQARRSMLSQPPMSAAPGPAPQTSQPSATSAPVQAAPAPPSATPPALSQPPQSASPGLVSFLSHLSCLRPNAQC